MDDEKLIKTAIFSLVAILFIALVNFSIINCAVWKTYNNSRKIIDNCLIVKKDSFNEYQREMFDRQEHIFKEYLREMETLKKGIFDNNTVTFMASFLLVFLGGILLGILNKSEKEVKKAKKIMDKIEVERNVLTLHTLLYTLFVFNENKNYYRLELETKKLLSYFHSGKYKYISKEWKADFVKMIDEKMLFYLNINKKYRKDVSLHESVKALEELKEKISSLIEIE